MSNNPYPTRPYPVGVLSYDLPEAAAAFVASVKKYCLLELGEAEVLYDIPRILGLGGDYVNLGHGAGGSAMLLARGIMDAQLKADVHSIDTFKMTSEDRVFGRTEAIEVVKSFGLESFVSVYKSTTSAMASDFDHISFVFIDADHSYNGVRNDFLNYAPKVVKGGAVSFHDTNQEASNQVIEEEVLTDPCWQLIFHVNRIKVFQRV